MNMYRIEYFYLEGHKALFESTGKRIICFDRRKLVEKNNICIISGVNGSGKTCLLSELTPFPGECSSIRRDSGQYIDSCGYKELHITYKEYIYICKLSFSQKKNTYQLFRQSSSSYEEITNDNALGTYITALYNHLGLDKSYLNIGFLSSDVKRLLNMSLTERMKYIGKWLPNIKELLDDYNKCRTKYSILQRDKKYLEKELSNLLIVSNELDMTNIDSSMEQLNAEIHEQQILHNKGKIYCEIYAEKAEMFHTMHDNFNKHCDMLEEFRDKLLNAAESIKNIENVQNIDNICDVLHKDLHLLDIKTNTLQNKIQATSNRLQDNENMISFIQKPHGDGLSVSNTDRIKELKTEIKIISKTLPKNNILSKYTDAHAVRSIIKLLEDLLTMCRCHNNILLNSGMDIKNMANVGFDTYFNNVVCKIRSLEERVICLEKERIGVMDKYQESKKTIIDEDLFNRLNAESCNSNCPIHKLSMYIGQNSQISTEIEENIRQIDLSINSVKDEIEENDNIRRNLLCLKNEIISSANRICVTIHDLHNNYDILFEDMENSLKYSNLHVFIGNFDKYIENIKNYHAIFNKVLRIIHIRELLDNEQRNEDSRNKLASLTTIRDGLKIDLKCFNEENISLNDERCILDDKIERNSYLKEQYHYILDNLHIYNDRVANKEIMFENLKIYAEARLRYDVSSIHLQNMKKIIDDKLSLRDTLQKNHREIKNKLALNESLKRRLVAIDSDIELCANLMDVWSPKTGLAALYINSFLINLKDTINDTLDAMWGEKQINVEDLCVSEEGFPINILRNEVHIGDATLCSDGEKAAITCAFSLSLMSLNIVQRGAYNILRLDEIDGMFDQGRRSAFVYILQEKMHEIQCQDCFIVSHNSEFEHIQTDLIELSSNSTHIRNNKQVLFSVI